MSDVCVGACVYVCLLVHASVRVVCVCKKEMVRKYIMSWARITTHSYLVKNFDPARGPVADRFLHRWFLLPCLIPQ